MIVRQHLAIARERNGVIGAELHESAAAHGVVHQFRQRVAEAAEAFAILVAGGEPTVFGRVIGPEIDIAVFLLDQQRRGGARGNFGIVGPQKLQRVARRSIRSCAGRGCARQASTTSRAAPSLIRKHDARQDIGGRGQQL